MSLMKLANDVKILMNAKEVSAHRIVRIQMEVLNANVSLDKS